MHKKPKTRKPDRPIVTFYRNVRGRIVKVGKRCHRELFADERKKGVLTPDRKQLHYHVPFPDYKTAVTYVVTRKLGYTIDPPMYGHWIDADYWTPLCVSPRAPGMYFSSQKNRSGYECISF